jgi:hypothetical protein
VVPALFFYHLLLVALLWLCVMLQWAWPSDTTTCPTTLEPTPLPPQRHPGPKPFRVAGKIAHIPPTSYEITDSE